MLKKSKEREIKERRAIEEFLMMKRKGLAKEKVAIKFYRDGGLFFPKRTIRKNLCLDEHDYQYWIPIFIFGYPLMLWVPEYSGLKPLFCPFIDEFWFYAEERGVGRVEIKIRVAQIRTEVKETLGTLKEILENGYGFPYFELRCVNPLIIGFRENSFESDAYRGRCGC